MQRKGTTEAIERAIPAGQERVEALSIHRDEVAEVNEKLANETGAVALDPAKLDVANVDNEIASHWNPEHGDIPFTHPQAGYLYAWVTMENSYPSTSAARTSIRAMHSAMKRVGWHPVEGDMPEGREFIGDAGTAGTTQRGMGDCMLWRIRREEWAKVEEHNKRKSLKNMGIEADFAEAVIRQTGGAAIPMDLNSPAMMRAYGAERMKPVTYSASFSQEQIRNGTGPLKPGFEIRGR